MHATRQSTAVRRRRPAVPRRLCLASTVLLAAAVTAGCGTRLPDAAFGAGGRPAAAGPTATGGDQPAGLGLEAPAGAGAPVDPAAGGTPAIDGAAPVDPAAGGAPAAVAPGGGQGVSASAGPVAVRPGGSASGPVATAGAVAAGKPRPGVGTGPTARASAAAGKTGAAPAPGAARPAAGPVNTASDVGVTPTTITVGNIVSRGGIFGPEQFAVSFYGVAAYFADLNAHGGVNGRQIRLDPCPDQGDEASNTDCVNRLVDTDKVFALVGNNVFKYAGARHVNETGTLDIGSQPIDSSYYRYQHLYNILGSETPRDGNPVTTNYGTGEIGAYFKEKVGVAHAGVVYYDQADSLRGASLTKQSLESAGIKVDLYAVNLGLPNFTGTVSQMQNAGVDGVWDALDANGNAKLCQAIESNADFLGKMKVKTSTISTWTQQIPTIFQSSPGCRNKIWATGSTRNYNDTGDPEVAKFRAAMKLYFGAREDRMAQWSLEGWVAGIWFTDAVRSCGANVTRACVEAFMKRPVDYKANGLLNGSTFVPKDHNGTNTVCPSVVAWSDAGGWATKNSPTGPSCYTTKFYSYPISA